MTKKSVRVHQSIVDWVLPWLQLLGPRSEHLRVYQHLLIQSFQVVRARDVRRRQDRFIPVHLMLRFAVRLSEIQAFPVFLSQLFRVYIWALYGSCTLYSE